MIVFDIDGVISDARHREHHVAARPKDYDAFFAELVHDAAIATGKTRLLAAAREGSVVLVSGRPERSRADTQDWLSRHGFPVLPLHLRADADFRPARVVKTEILRSLGGPLAVDLVIDDDPTVIDALSAAGYTCELFVADDETVEQLPDA